MLGSRLSRLFQARSFKTATFVVGSLFIALTFVIYLNPEPFLKFGYLGVFIFNLFGPGTLLIPLLSLHMNVVALAFVSAVGMALNDSVGWMVGRSGDVVIRRSKRVAAVEKTVHKFGPFAIFLWALIPIPHDITGLAAGYLGFPYKKFLIPAFLGIFVRFLSIGFGTVVLLGR